MPAKAAYTVRFEPVGIEMEVEEGETVLDAAFRQGIALMHGCKEGQCASCKSILNQGDIELLKHSTFALSEAERDEGYILLCRTLVYSDIEVELLNYDEELMSRSIPVKEYDARICAIDPLTHDILRLEVESETALKFWAGQYVDVTVPGKEVTRSYSMANPPGQDAKLAFIIKKYPGGAFSSLLESDLGTGSPLVLKGPFGMCFRREGRVGPMVLIGGGSGMSPLWSILQDHLAAGEPRRVIFFYGARARRDLFYLDELAAISRQDLRFRFVPALSACAAEDDWPGEVGPIHEVVARRLLDMADQGWDSSETDVYACGPAPMIDAVLGVLQGNNLERGNIYVDRFTPFSAPAANPKP